ncbi:MAG: sigma-70 family RNA polymerase sigma factor [Dehalococcoidia bacterium]|nr:sigma-70 family RNA polymerase sigma factor [Dehalococcoidia bacterium]
MNQEPARIHSGAETSLTDGDIAAIVQQAQNGEAAAFGQLYEIYSDRVFRYVAYRVDSDADAEDITEDVFIRMLEAIGSFKWRNVPFSAWLMRIAHNRVIDHYRRGRLRTATPLDDAPPLASRDRDPQERVDTFSDLQELRVAMAGLTDLQRQVISLRFGSDLSIAETAHVMNRNEGAVKALQHSAIRALRRLMLPRNADAGETP